MASHSFAVTAASPWPAAASTAASTRRSHGRTWMKSRTSAG